MKRLTLPLRRSAKYLDGRPGEAPMQGLHQRGFTLVELSVSMAIAAILVLSSLVVLRQQLDQALVSSSSFFLQQTMVSLQDFFVGDNNSAPINNNVLTNSDAVARAYVSTDTDGNLQITNSWGGRLFLDPLITGQNSDWVLQVSGLPMRLCADIVQNLESSLNAASLRHTLAGAAAADTQRVSNAVALNTDNLLGAAQPNVQVLKNSPYTPINPLALRNLCETRQPYFNLFLAGKKHAL
ncbi:type II secretion system GspH family protein [Herbaspirillum sp. DW155]|uniref:type II secretion system protein n=1 Tax=Herbaspirillum sp. DW155 TaxID=3095609 RepID=UPI00308E9152|nr:type II secretion system GspH family protein [Herbaspirillum sp. DW155]